MSEEDYKDLGKIKNKWIEKKDEYLDMSLNIIEKLNLQIKQQNELIDNIRAECLSEIHNCYVEEKELNGSIKEILDLIKEYEEMKGKCIEYE